MNLPILQKFYIFSIPQWLNLNDREKMFGVAKEIPGGLLLAAALLLPAGAMAAHKSQSKAAPMPAALTFNPPGGVYTNQLSVQISAQSPGTGIRYTLDGTEPTEQSQLYATPLVMTNSVLLRARSFGGRSNDHNVAASQTYCLLDQDVAGFSSNLPLILINTFGQEIEKESKTAATARFIKLDGPRCSISGPAEFDGRALVNLRGRASLRYPKRSYTLRPLDAQDEFLKGPLLGLPSDSDWILYAPYPDKTFIRDALAYELSNEMGQYASRTRFVELFVNETPGKLSKMSYMGVYVLEEKVKRGKERVNVAKLAPEDNAEPKITGGYIFKK